MNNYDYEEGFLPIIIFSCNLSSVVVYVLVKYYVPVALASSIVE